MAVSRFGLETWEIKYHFWVRLRDFQTSILFPVFNSKLQVWFSFSQPLLRNLNLILVLLDLYLQVSNCKVLRRAQIQTLKQTFTWVQTRENLGFKPRTSNPHSVFLVYFNRPWPTALNQDRLSILNTTVQLACFGPSHTPPSLLYYSYFIV